MPTFKPIVYTRHTRKDKTYPIRIRVTHKRKRRYINTGLVATADDLFRNSRIKNRGFLDSCAEIIKGYRIKCNELGPQIIEMDADEIVTFLLHTKNDYDLDFLAFGTRHVERLKAEGRATTARGYNAAMNAVKRFIGRETLNVSEINVYFLKDFERWIKLNPIKPDPLNHRTMQRAPSHYLSSLRALHNEMKLQYNDEDAGTIPIPYSPFGRYRMPSPPVTEKRAITPELIRKIYDLESVPAKNSKGASRFNLAKDCFILSFCLMGMNSADLYHCPPIKDGKITYRRKKTHLRRKDQALMCVSITPEIVHLVASYIATGANYAFSFHRHYANEENFNRAINQGLKLVGKEIGMTGLTFYAARHSWATIALNECGIDKYTVHACLNHVDPEMKVTDIYIRKDWTVINEANRKVLDYVLSSKTEPRVIRVPGLTENSQKWKQKIPQRQVQS